MLFYYINSITGERRDFTFDMITFLSTHFERFLAAVCPEDIGYYCPKESVMSNQIYFRFIFGFSVAITPSPSLRSAQKRSNWTLKSGSLSEK